MIPIQEFLIAGHRIRVQGRFFTSAHMKHFGMKPFLCSGPGCAVSQTPFSPSPIVLQLHTQVPLPAALLPSVGPALSNIDLFGTPCSFHPYPQGYCLLITPPQGSVVALWTGTSPSEVCSNVALEAMPEPNRMRFILWMAYGLSVLPLQTLPVHASVAVYNQKALLFIAPSGTGKSTQTQLWRTHVPGTLPLNDDCPVVRVLDHQVWASGSPWSGKTPVYLNESYEMGAFIEVAQAPQNRITRLGKLPALGALLAACPPDFMFATPLADLICETLSAVLPLVPVYHLGCLPNAEAVHVTLNTLQQDGVI